MDFFKLRSSPQRVISSSVINLNHFLQPTQLTPSDYGTSTDRFIDCL